MVPLILDGFAIPNGTCLYQMVRTGPPTDRYVDRPLPRDTFDWSLLAWLQRGEEKRKRKRENLKSRPTPPSLNDPNPLPPSLVERCR
ncbi:hypothetical protein BHM03_00024969 [Ensete ventricosum]|nr:hypothetical protein BHM03_00024969 [Ensete ventricosum]